MVTSEKVEKSELVLHWTIQWSPLPGCSQLTPAPTEPILETVRLVGAWQRIGVKPNWIWFFMFVEVHQL